MTLGLPASLSLGYSRPRRLKSKTVKGTRIRPKVPGFRSGFQGRVSAAPNATGPTITPERLGSGTQTERCVPGLMRKSGLRDTEPVGCDLRWEKADKLSCHVRETPRDIMSGPVFFLVMVCVWCPSPRSLPCLKFRAHICFYHPCYLLCLFPKLPSCT
jgi:hypothetical protein